MRNGRNATVHFLLLLRPDSEHRKTREALTTATAEILALRGELPGTIHPWMDRSTCKSRTDCGNEREDSSSFLVI